jgi:hypothetical protein
MRSCSREKRTHSNHVGGADAARDHGGLPVYHGVPERARILEARIVGHEDRTSKPHPQCAEHLLGEFEVAPIQSLRFHR